MSIKWVSLFSTFFYLGYLPLCAGSVASAVGVALAYFLCPHKELYVLTFLLITLIGFVASGRMEKCLGKKDPRCIVIDEVAGALVAFWGLPLTWPVMFTGFFLFRAFDMFKICPANKFESLSGGTGVMMDDLIAGVYTNITMHVALGLLGSRAF